MFSIQTAIIRMYSCENFQYKLLHLAPVLWAMQSLDSSSSLHFNGTFSAPFRDFQRQVLEKRQ